MERIINLIQKLNDKFEHILQMALFGTTRWMVL